MIRLAPNDLIAVSSGLLHYHAIVLTSKVLFGGSLCYVFHERSRTPRDASYFLARHRPGFHAIVDWRIPNREARVTRLAREFDVSQYDSPGLFIHAPINMPRHPSPAKTSKPITWSIVDEKLREKKRTRRLTEEESRLPSFSCLSGDFAIKLAGKKWGVSPRG